MSINWAQLVFVAVALLTGTTYLVLAGVTWRQGPRTRYRRLWVAFCLTGAVHILSLPLSTVVTTAVAGDVVVRFSMSLSCAVLALFLWFSLAFAGPVRGGRALGGAFTAAAGALVVALWAGDWVMAGVAGSEFSRYAPVAGPLMPIFLPFDALAWVAPGVILFRSWRRAAGVERSQLGYVLLATGFGLVGTSGYLLPGILRSQTLYAFLPAVLLPLFPLTITTAIVRHRLWGIRTILHRTAAWLVLSLVLVVPVGAALWLGARLLPPMSAEALALLLSALFLAAFAYLRRVKPVVDHWFQRRELDRQRMLERFDREMAALRRPGEVAERLLATLAQAVYPQHAALWLPSPAGTPWLVLRRPDDGRRPEPGPLGPELAGLDAIEAAGGAVDLDTIEPRPDWCAALAAGGIRQLVLLAQAGQRVGLLELGEKANLKPYSREDLEFVEQLCASGAVGLSNALLFDRSDAQRRELVELSATLEQRVVERTDELRRANERLRDLDRLKSRFFANISHELRTPLSLVLAPLESMLDGELGELDGGQRERLAGIQRNALQLLKLIDDLLDLSKLEEARLRLRLAPVELAALAERIVDTAAPLAERKRIVLAVQAEAEAQIEADEEKLERVIVNLVGNALKFTDAGGQVTVVVGQEGDEAWLRVCDDGIGIPADQLEVIFDRFHQVDASVTRRHGGSGIGLSLARELVELHGGRLDAAAAEGRGSTFELRLPRTADGLPAERIERRRRDQPVDQRRRAEDRGLPEWNDQIRASQRYKYLDIDRATERRVVQRQSPAGPKAARLLVVDDNPEVLQYLEQVLGDRWELWHSQDGERALELLRAQRHDLVLADVMMPGMSGLELCQRIKGDPRLQATPVVLLTARSGEQARIEGHYVGADQYLSKPFKPAELRAAIEGLLAGRSRQSEAAAHRRAASLETLLAGLAHELRNACHQARNAQTAAGEMLRRELDAERDAALMERLERMQAIAQRALARIAAVVQSLQQYAFQRLQVAWAELDVDALVERAVGQLTEAEAKGVALELSLESAARVRGPHEALRQLVLNLVENAIQAVEPGGAVRVSTRAQTGRVLLEVADDGCGMEAEQRERIFDLFYTTKEPGRGIGLGLAMVDKTVADMGGKLAVASRPGQGSRFTVDLPRLERSAPPPAEAAVPEPDAPAPDAG